MKNRQLIPEILFAAITKSASGKGDLSHFFLAVDTNRRKSNRKYEFEQARLT